MYAGNWQEMNGNRIEIQEKAVRGTISNRLKNAIVSDPQNWMLKSKSQPATGGCGFASGRYGYVKGGVYAACAG